LPNPARFLICLTSLALTSCLQAVPSPPLGLTAATATAAPLEAVQLVPPLPTGEGGFSPTLPPTVLAAIAQPSPTGWQAMTLPPGLRDVLPLMSGICFEAAYDAAERVFVLRSAAELEAFYGLADNSRLCRRPVTRYAFDFTGGAALIGTWTRGMGCIARHELLDVARDEAARSIGLSFRFVVEGDCAYELVRPLWLAIDQGASYDISLRVESAG